MKTHNELVMSPAELHAAIEYYLNEKVFSTKVVVGDVALETPAYGSNKDLKCVRIQLEPAAVEVDSRGESQ